MITPFFASNRLKTEPFAKISQTSQLEKIKLPTRAANGATGSDAQEAWCPGKMLMSQTGLLSRTY
jgi:hypothetical protein